MDRIKLRDITPDKIQRWKVEFLNQAGSSPAKRRAASISVNSLLRQAKSLFAPGILKFVKLDLSSSPFEGVQFEPRRSMRYQSSFDLEKTNPGSAEEECREQFKIFLLAIMAGLRRNEIDKLEWNAFDWNRAVISIKATSYFSPKSEDSTGDVEVDPEVMELFRGYLATASGDFVIESRASPRPDAAYSHYRCEREFEALNKWLLNTWCNRKSATSHAAKGIWGYEVCAKHGIYAASRALRHRRHRDYESALPGQTAQRDGRIRETPLRTEKYNQTRRNPGAATDKEGCRSPTIACCFRKSTLFQERMKSNKRKDEPSTETEMPEHFPLELVAATALRFLNQDELKLSGPALSESRC